MTSLNAGQTNSQAFKRTFDDIVSRPIEDLVLSEGTVYGARYYTVEPIGGNWMNMEAWCRDIFKDTGPIWGEKAPEPAMRWYANNRKFWFSTEQDRNWFILRWSGS
jgi:hypothetical protein